METTSSLAETKSFCDGAPTLGGHGPTLPRGPAGRYVLGEPIGAGGMGEVYSAFDPTLQRSVALKLVNPRGEDTRDAEERLRREARALARLSHPNVVPVFDVGTLDRRVFVAMERVDGQSLRSWIRQRTRPWREVLGVLLEAGRGLAAAHRAGVVHRDFKPSNVMVGEDGRARVLDFGLAFQVAIDSESSVHDSESVSLRVPSDDLTETGVILGTPSYMAPEQFLGHEVDACCDQFAFCVTAYLLLYDHKPFAGQSLPELRRAVLAGPPLPPPRRSRVPRRVWRALRRGLARAPTERYPTMDDLLLALERAARGRGRVGLTAAVVGVGVLLGGLALASRDAHDERCGDVEPRAEAVWGDERRQLVHEAFEATGLPYASAAWGEVDERLTQYVEGWVATRQAACREAIDGVVATAGFDRRIACLERGLARAAALAQALERSDVRVVEHAVAALSSLPLVADCDDDAELARAEIPPELAPQAAALERDLDDVEARLATHDDEDRTLAAADACAARAAALDLPALVARAQRARGSALRRVDDDHAARAAFEAAMAASAELGDARGEIVAQIALVDVLSGPRLSDPEGAVRQARHAEALLARIEPDPRLTLELRAVTGRALLDAGRPDEAEAVLRQVLEARAEGDELASILADARGVLGIAVARQGRFEESVELLRAALATREAQLGPDHPDVARMLGNLGSSLTQLGELDEAKAVLTRAIDVYTQAAGPKAKGLETLWQNLAALHRQRGEDQPSLDAMQRALDLVRDNRGPDDPSLGWMHSDMGTHLFSMGRMEEAQPHLLEAVRIFETSQGEASPGLVYTLSTLMQNYLRKEDPAGAAPYVARGLLLLERAERVEPAATGMLRYSIAMTMWELDDERPRALAIARQAVADARRSERPLEPQLAAMTEWIAEHEALLDQAPARG